MDTKVVAKAIVNNLEQHVEDFNKEIQDNSAYKDFKPTGTAVIIKSFRDANSKLTLRIKELTEDIDYNDKQARELIADSYRWDTAEILYNRLLDTERSEYFKNILKSLNSADLKVEIQAELELWNQQYDGIPEDIDTSENETNLVQALTEFFKNRF